LPKPTQQTLVRLSCLNDDAQGISLDVVWDLEVDAQLIGATSWQAAAQHASTLRDGSRPTSTPCTGNGVTSTTPWLFQAPYRARIKVMAYRLEPLRKALLLPRGNLFIADDVGLGKTIEAGLILRELLMRQKGRRLVMACLSSVVFQRRDEPENRFGLPGVVFDQAYLLS